MIQDVHDEELRKRFIDLVTATQEITQIMGHQAEELLKLARRVNALELQLRASRDK